MAKFSLRPAAAAVISVSLLLQTPGAHALTLLQAYEAALKNDPTYRGATHAHEAGQQNIAMGRANLLPQLSASYSRSKNNSDITFPSLAGPQTVNTEYFSDSRVVQLRQPVVNLDGIARYKQGIAQAAYADEQFNFQKQDLIVRLVGAYADAQYAEDQLTLVTIQRDAYAEQMKVNQRMFEKGEGTKTDMLETQAKYDLGESQVLEARDSVVNARNALAAMIGVEVNKLDGLSDNFPIKPLQPAGFDEWRSIALKQNPEIAAQRHAVEANQQEINKNYAGHAPHVDFTASYGRSASDSINTINQEYKTKSYGVQVTIPIYSGGSVSAGIKQASEQYEQAKADLDAKTNQVLVELRKQYNLVLSSTSKIDALVKSVKSAQLVVEATRQSIKGGVRINLDLLNAQQQLYMAKRDLAQARYNYLLSYLRMRSSAGALNAEDLQFIAGYFKTEGDPRATADSIATDKVVAKYTGRDILGTSAPDSAAAKK